MARRLILSAGLLLLAAMGAYPPWVTAPEKHPSATTPVGYHFILRGPYAEPAKKVVWSSERNRHERDGRPLSDAEAKRAVAGDAWVQAFDRAFYGDPILERARAKAERRFVRIDYARLGVQLIVVAALIGVGIVLTSRRRREG